MPDEIDTGWTGTPAAMASALASLGWEPTPSDAPPPMHPDVRGFTPVQRTQINGAQVWVVFIRSVAALPLPAGVTLAPSWLSAAACGGFAALARPRERSKVQIYSRMTDAELATLEALLAAATTRQRMSWNDATVIEVDRADVQALAVAAFGAERAAAILA